MNRYGDAGTGYGASSSSTAVNVGSTAALGAGAFSGYRAVRPGAPNIMYSNAQRSVDAAQKLKEAEAAYAAAPRLHRGRESSKLKLAQKTKDSAYAREKAFAARAPKLLNNTHRMRAGVLGGSLGVLGATGLYLNNRNKGA